MKPISALTDHVVNCSLKHTMIILIAVTGFCVVFLTLYPDYQQKKIFSQTSFNFRQKLYNIWNRYGITGQLMFKNASQDCSQFVSVGKWMSHGLGNQMFYFAAALYVASVTEREVVLFRNHQVQTLVAAFDLKVRKLNITCPSYNFYQSGLSYDSRLEKLNISHIFNKTIVVNGHFQSWKYPDPVKELLRQHYSFKIEVKDFAVKFLEENKPSGWSDGFVQIGIHCRRGDFVVLSYAGFNVGTESYFQKAMEYFVKKYNRIQFIVASNDMTWSRRYIYYNRTNEASNILVNVTYLLGHTAFQDMAILSRCKHVIVSVGSYGWWSAWLTGSTATYYADYPRPNSSLLKEGLNPIHYYPPNWVPFR